MKFPETAQTEGVQAANLDEECISC